MEFNRIEIDKVQPENMHKVEMLEAVMDILVKGDDVEDALNVLCAAMAHIVYMGLEPYGWDDNIKEMSRLVTDFLQCFPHHERMKEH